MNQDDRLGPYRLQRQLGEGGMGVVHLATDPRGREVAVKVLRNAIAGDDMARRRLAREVETMRRVRSPFIAEVVDADVTGKRPYIVTQYVPGRPLDDVVKEDGPLEGPALVRVAYGIAKALEAVHAGEVVHRDLKPSNVMMLDGSPVLIDFGIAQAVDATRLTQTGMFIGTPGYLAPEIIEGHESGPAVDVHAWAGTVLYAASGQSPFGAGTLEMIFYNITAGKADISPAPKTLRPLLKAAFTRDPRRRPTAGQLAAQIERLQSPVPPSPPPQPADEGIPTKPRFDTDQAARQAQADISTGTYSPAADSGQYVSLLGGEQSGRTPGAAWPTGRADPVATPEGDIPTHRVRPDHPPIQPQWGIGRQAPPPSAGQPYDPALPTIAKFDGTAAQQGRPQTAGQPPPAPPGGFGFPQQGYQPPALPRRGGAANTAVKWFLLLALVAATVLIPVIVIVLVLPLIVLLRASDMARDKGPGGGGLGLTITPGSVFGSLGVTLALVPYGAILGLPVTLLLAILVKDMPAGYALSWGAATFVWTLSAGPGVEGPSRQMDRTLGALLPGRGSAIAAACVAGVVACALAALAVSSVVGGTSDAIWAPFDVGVVLDELVRLRAQT
ncbi:serine/threonine-protein kinase [Rhizohabitans arisaemae]|uniref:serine/threonine-protein kinase n=1 Tax=Rhizohabitans arisaemae TaxID=2720610 RepID=UPI0024B279FD|nr:serine/threonine-protein kinase [Rhizohabitans arisaemae]